MKSESSLIENNQNKNPDNYYRCQTHWSTVNVKFTANLGTHTRFKRGGIRHYSLLCEFIVHLITSQLVRVDFPAHWMEGSSVTLDIALCRVYLGGRNFASKYLHYSGFSKRTFQFQSGRLCRGKV